MTAQHPGSFLITTWDGGGNVPPAIALGQRLVRRGHGVRVIGSRTLAGAVDESGLAFVAYTSLPDWPAGVPLDADIPRLMAMLDGDAMAADIARELEREPADVLIADCMSGAALAAAASLAVPTAILVHVLYELYAQNWGPRARALAGRTRVLCLTPPGFDAAVTAVPEETFHVGPVLAPDAHEQAWSPRGDLPVVLVSFSTTLMGQSEALPPVLAALAELPVQGMLTLGGVVDRAAIRAPDNVSVYEYLPHAAILPHAAAVVTHGGLSTITSALAYGVPLVCLPQGRDQPLNAERVEATGVGRSLAAGSPPEAVAAAVREVLDDSRYRAAAEAMAREISELGRGAVAAQLTEGLLPSPGGSR